MKPDPAEIPVQPNPRNSSLWIVTSIVVVLLLAIIGLLLYQNSMLKQQLSSSPVTSPTAQLTPTPLPSSTVVDPTANWKTFTNQSYGFEIKYPSTPDVVAYGCKNIYGEEGDEYFYIAYEKWAGKSWNPSLLAKCRITSINPGWILFVQEGKYKNTLGNDYKVKLKDSVVVNGVTATKFLYEKPESVEFDERWQRVVHTVLYQSDMNRTFVFELNHPEDEQFFDQILSTFKFVDNKISKDSCPNNLVIFENDIFTICHPAGMSETNNYYNPVDRSNVRAVNTVFEDSNQRILITTAFTGGWGGGYETESLTLAGFPVTLLSAKDENNNVSNIIALINSENRQNQFPVAIDFQKKSDKTVLNTQYFKDIIGSFRLK